MKAFWPDPWRQLGTEPWRMRETQGVQQNWEQALALRGGSAAAKKERKDGEETEDGEKSGKCGRPK